MSARDGGPAFPGEIFGTQHGMSLRDWFAGQALAGLTYGGKAMAADVYAREAYCLADAMLAARDAFESAQEGRESAGEPHSGDIGSGAVSEC